MFGEKFPNYITFLFLLLPLLLPLLLHLLYTDTLNWIWKYPRSIDRTSFLWTLTRTETGGRIRPLSPGFVFCNHLSIILDIPSPSLHFLHDSSTKKGGKKKSSGPVTLMENNSVSLGLSSKIIKWMDSQIFGFWILLTLTVYTRRAESSTFVFSLSSYRQSYVDSQ